MNSMYIANWLVSKQDEKKQWVSVNEVRDSLLKYVIASGFPKVLKVDTDIIDMIIIDTHKYWLEQAGILISKFDFKNRVVIYNTAKVIKKISSAKIKTLDVLASIPTEVIEREKQEKLEDDRNKYAEHSQILEELGIELSVLE